MTAHSIVAYAREVVSQEAPLGADTEDCLWFAAAVLHDIWLLPACHLIEKGSA